MANLKAEIPNLKLNDGTFIPMVRALPSPNLVQHIDRTL